jgi:predicted nuclease of restriction endonuclease-like (RecB) superfamily
MVTKRKKDEPVKKPDVLFDRVVSILEQARGSVVRAVNSNMVLAYWLIGREIVEDMQGGKERAGYGRQVVENLSAQLMERYGSGFSVPNLKSFRQFYQTYPDRYASIGYPSGSQSTNWDVLHPADMQLTLYPRAHPSEDKLAQGFSSRLSWSHYRALMRVEDPVARLFYERETEECGWSKVQLERQIHSSHYERIIANHGQKGLTATERDRLPGDPLAAAQVLKSPYVLEFLGLPDSNNLHETALEQAVIDNLQAFLLELGKGFSFVARQKHIQFDEDDFFVDMVFYNYVLKCFLLIDLKIGKLTHRDVGQMDGYVRLFEEQFKVPGDNPTIGLILCSDKGEAVARYSVLREDRQIFASKYLPFLPTEKQLQMEIEKERKLIEAILEERRDP